MKLRTCQLVCLALLLATLRLADPSAPEFAFQATYLNVLLTPDPPATTRVAIPEPIRRANVIPALPVRAQRSSAQPYSATLDTAWTMSPPAFQSAALQSTTGFGRHSA